MTARPNRLPAARVWCRCWRSASPRRRCWSICASLRNCGRSGSTQDGVALGAMVRWRDILDDARLATAHPLLVAAVEPRRALSDPQPRHRRRQPGACRSRRRNAGHRGDLRSADRRRRQGRHAQHRGRRFLPRTADDRAASPTKSSPKFACRHGRRSAASVFRNSPAAAAISRLRRRCCSTTTTAAKRATRMSAPSASPTGRCGCRRGTRCSTATRSTRP